MGKWIKNLNHNYIEYERDFIKSQSRVMHVLTILVGIYAIIAPMLISRISPEADRHTLYFEFGLLAVLCVVPHIGFSIIMLTKKEISRFHEILYEVMITLFFGSISIIYLSVALISSYRIGETAELSVFYIISLVGVAVYKMHPLNFDVMYIISFLVLYYNIDNMKLADVKQLYNMVIFVILIIILYGIKYHSELRSFHKSKQIMKMQSDKEKLLVQLTHEMRTPLNAVLGKNQMIMLGASEEETKLMTRQIDSSGKILLSLINDILDLSKIDSGKMSIVPVEYNLSHMIEEIISIMGSEASSHAIEFKTELADIESYELCGDEIRIKQIIVNLISNAIKYTPRGSVTLCVRFEESDDQTGVLRVDVRDTGIGIKKEDLPRLTEEFVRVDEKTNRAVLGTGLGLSITSNLLRMMDSKLEVDSTYGVGSRFSFSLKQEIVSKENSEDVSSLDIADQIIPDARILVVDDNRVNYMVISGLIKRLGIVPEYAASGVECIRLIEDNEYDLIFLDHMMPEMDGVETLKHLREKCDGKCDKTPIIALTANYDSDAENYYEKLGFNAYLGKPVDLSKLQEVLIHFLNK